MAELLPTYEYHGEEIRAVFEGHVIASGAEFSKVSTSAMEYLDGLAKKRKHDEHESARKVATHITTPHGAKGEILTRVPSIWGEEITVRFENGQIRRFATMAGDEHLSYTRENPDAPKSIREAMMRELEEDYDHGISGLTTRLDRLSAIKTAASNYAASERSPLELQEYHKMVLAADQETLEIKEALAHLEDADTVAYVPPVYAAVEQADLGRAKGDTWLDVTARKMIAESEDEDYDKLLEEGPVNLVSAMEDAAVHDAGVVREAAINFIVARTAGFQGEKIDAYREAFVAKAEQARRQDLNYRKEAHQEAVQKEASVTDDISDEALFL